MGYHPLDKYSPPQQSQPDWEFTKHEYEEPLPDTEREPTTRPSAAQGLAALFILGLGAVAAGVVVAAVANAATRKGTPPQPPDPPYPPYPPYPPSPPKPMWPPATDVTGETAMPVNIFLLAQSAQSDAAAGLLPAYNPAARIVSPSKADDDCGGTCDYIRETPTESLSRSEAATGRVHFDDVTITPTPKRRRRKRRAKLKRFVAVIASVLIIVMAALLVCLILAGIASQAPNQQRSQPSNVHGTPLAK